MNALHVGVNCLYLRPGLVGGSEIYVRSLLRAMRARDDVRLTVYAPPEAAGTFGDLPVRAIGRAGFSQARRLWHENVSLALPVRRDGVDVLFSPANFAAPALPAPVPQVVTVHDLQHLWLTEHFSRAKRLQRSAMFRASFLRCAHIIAISEFTRGDVIRHYRVLPERITTVLEGFDRTVARDEAAEQATLRKYAIEGPFFYYPATDNAHKNHEGLIDALGALRDRHGLTPSLILTGSRSDRWRAITDRAEHLGVGRQVHHLGFVDRDEVYHLMAQAQGLAFASRFEGFGLPLLEAMQCDTPVLASRCASIPEVAGDAALLLDPDDAAEWADAMARVLGDSSLWARLVARGRENLDRFSWDRCARETTDILRAAVH